MKPGPLIAMLVLLGLGVWLVLQPSLSRPSGQMVTRIGAVELRYEQREGDAGFEYRVVNQDGLADRWISSGEFERLVRREWEAWSARPALDRMLLGFFNITSWGNFAWVVVGLGGQIAFFGRMLIQWVVSEKQRQSVVPPLFWWLSLGGGICLFTYFVWRVDFVGVLGQSTGIVIYARNLRLISKQRRREARTAARAVGPDPETSGGRSNESRPARGGAEVVDPDADPAPEPTRA